MACALSSGCSFLIDVGGDQCSTNSDCDRPGVGGTCELGVCVAMSSSASRCDGGECASPADASDEVDAGDAGTDASTTPLCSGVRCEEGEVCFSEQCAIASMVEPFMCETVEPPPPVGTVRFTMPVRDFVSDEPLTDMVVLACRENDVTCADPIARFDDEGATGDVELQLPYEFQGYLEVRSSDALTSLWYFTEPLLAEMHAKVLKALAPSTIELLGSIAGLDVDVNSKGIVILEAFDCERNAAGGIQFQESKHSAIPFFVINDIPNKEGTVTVRNDVENQAAGGFVNAAPGFTLFSAHIGVDGPLLGVEINANVKANTVTYVDIHP